MDSTSRYKRTRPPHQYLSDYLLRKRKAQATLTRSVGSAEARLRQRSKDLSKVFKNQTLATRILSSSCWQIFKIANRRKLGKMLGWIEEPWLNFALSDETKQSSRDVGFCSSTQPTCRNRFTKGEASPTR